MLSLSKLPVSEAAWRSGVPDGQPAAMDGYTDNCVMAMAIATYPENVSLALQAFNPTQVTKRDLGL
jgi:hypothetical protein